MELKSVTINNFTLTTYLILTKFEVYTVSYRLSFFPSVYGPHALCLGHISKSKSQQSITYSMDWQHKVSKIFIIHVSVLFVWHVQEWFLSTQNSFKFPTHIESKTNQFEIAVKLLARFNTQFIVEERFKLQLATKVKKHLAINQQTF